MNPLDRWLSRWDRGWLLLASAVLFILFLLLVLPAQAERAQAYSEGVGSPDTDLLTPPAELYRIAEGYGPEGRRQYIQARWTFDVIFPLVYGFFLFSSINISFHRLWAQDHKWARAALLAPAAVLFDLLENTALSLLMGIYPRRILGLAEAAVVASTIKWLLVYSGMTLALLGLAAWGAQALWRRIR